MMPWSHMWDGGWGWGGWLVMTISMLLFWGALIALAVWAIRQLAAPRDRDRGERPASALAILEERYARGEIDREEFERRRAVLLSR